VRICYAACPIPSSSSRLCHHHPLPSRTLQMSGKRGSGITGAHAGALARYTRQTLCIRGTSFDNMFGLASYTHSCRLRCSPSLTSCAGQQCHHCWQRRERFLDAFAAGVRFVSKCKRDVAQHRRSASSFQGQSAVNGESMVTANKLYTS